MAAAMAVAVAAVVVLPACAGNDAATPEGAVRLLIVGGRAGDRGAVYRRLGPRTRARLQAIQTTTRRTSGRLALGPEDLLSVGWAPPAWEPAGMRTLRRDADAAEVEVYSATGDRHTVHTVREGAEWKVELPE
jgi:hypothetical protein